MTRFMCFLGKKQKSQIYLNPIALRKAKIVYDFGLSECNRVKVTLSGKDLAQIFSKESAMPFLYMR